MQIESVPTKVGVAICDAPSRIATSSGLCIAWLRWIFSTSTVASSTSIPTASAIPPSVIVLIVCPVSLSPMIAVRIESGIDVITISMLRGEPRNISTISATSNAAVTASCTTSRRAARTNSD